LKEAVSGRFPSLASIDMAKGSEAGIVVDEQILASYPSVTNPVSLKREKSTYFCT
jgi:hypothetical protein